MLNTSILKLHLHSAFTCNVESQVKPSAFPSLGSYSLLSSALHVNMEIECIPFINNTPLLGPTETDDKMRAFAERVFASETKDETMRDEISMFDVEECPILQNEMAHHVHTEDDIVKRWDGRWFWAFGPTKSCNDETVITRLFYGLEGPDRSLKEECKLNSIDDLNS